MRAPAPLSFPRMITGTCLCGACTWRFAATPPRVTACDRSACRRYGAIWVYSHKGDGNFGHGTTRGTIADIWF